ncbi:uncharacterized protein LOC34622454 [Cyclospora cayetanensis]|uniref:Uncharacterized protein LOC34622454 n=1 Tax=Cyclospora cayetanensis TaxID=88456 RepID=A0A6P6RZK8_9EIME|nr:uncharacterized protein LOC34622454 [Cyclospora cayetanensis]
MPASPAELHVAYTTNANGSADSSNTPGDVKAADPAASSGRTRGSSSSHAFSSTVLLPRSPLRLRGDIWRSELAVQRLWRRHRTYERLLLQIWCLNRWAQEHNTSGSSSNNNSSGGTSNIDTGHMEQSEISDAWLDALGFALTPPNSEDRSSSNVLLLDGPPYANGEPHLGHAVNKCLKDFAVRAALLQRRCCHLLPGWDCHGLPIELRAAAAEEAQRKGGEASPAHFPILSGLQRREGNPADASSDTRPSRSKEEEGESESLRRRARLVALHFASQQQKAFERFGVWAHWEDAYKTLDTDFKAKELRLFALLWNQGLISPSRFPVYWSTASLSAVSDSEVIFKPTNRECLYLKFLLQEPPSLPERTLPLFKQTRGPWYFVSWTTTPFTVPASRALALHPKAQYAILKASMKGSHGLSDACCPSETGGTKEEIWLVGEKCVPSFMEALRSAEASWTAEQIGTLSGDQLGGLRYVHPVASSVTCPVLLDPVVEVDKGTAVLHVAPAHSQEDFRLCERAGRGTFLVVKRAGGNTSSFRVPLLPELEEEEAAAAAGAPLLCPVGPQGTFLGGIGSDPFKGLEALKGGEDEICAFLRRKNTLLLTGLLPRVLRDLHSIRWLPARRSHNVQQQHDIKEGTQEGDNFKGTSTEDAKSEGRKKSAADEMQAAPQAGSKGAAAPGYERIRAALLTRPSTWCISRQRLAHKFIQRWTASANALLSQHLPKKLQQQAQCSQHQQPSVQPQQQPPPQVSQQQQQRHEGRAEPYCCLVIEGSDQSRGWFQSMLLSHAGAREALRRQQAKWERTAEALQPGDTPDTRCMFKRQTDQLAPGIAGPGADRQPLAGEDLGEWDIPKLPFNLVVTHGFVVDSSGNKLSKSKGTALSPALFFTAEREAQQAVTATKALPSAASSIPTMSQPQQLSQQRQRKDGQLMYGADVLRLFVGSLDFGTDMACPSWGPEQRRSRDTAVHASSAAYIKLRNLFKYLIGALQDFDLRTHAVSLEDLPLLDVGMILRLKALADGMGTAYETLQSNKALRLLLRFVSEDLSATYLETAKDRLYLDHYGGYRRRSCQTVLAISLLALLPLVAPLTPHLAEETFWRMPHGLRRALCVHRTRKVCDLLGSKGGELARTLGLMGWPRMHYAVAPRKAAEAERLWTLLLLLRQDLHWLFTRAGQQQKDCPRGHSRLGSLNDLKLTIDAPSRESHEELRKLLPQAKLLRPAPHFQFPPGQQTSGRRTPAHCRSYVDDLRWLLQCSEVVLRGPEAAEDHLREEGGAGEALASLEAAASKSGLGLRLYRAQGLKCQR